MKLLSIHNLPSGGALRSLYEMCKCIQIEGFEHTLISFESSDHSVFQFDKVVTQHIIEPLSSGSIPGLMGFIGRCKYIAHQINQQNVDLVIVHKCRYFGTLPIIQYLKIPSIYYCQEPIRFKEYERLVPSLIKGANQHRIQKKTDIFQVFRRVQNLFRHQLIKHIDRKHILASRDVVVNSAFSKEWIKNVYAIQSRIVYLGVNHHFFKPLNLPKENRVLSVGRLDIIKGHEFAIKVLSEIHEKIRPKLVIVADSGKDSQKSDLKKMSIGLGVDCDILLEITDEQLREQYCVSKIVLCFSANEPFGMVPLEAMACATPVVALNQGGYKETMIHGKTGYLVEPNTEACAESIVDFLCSSDKATQMGCFGREHVLQNWSWDNFLNRLLPGKYQHKD